MQAPGKHLRPVASRLTSGFRLSPPEQRRASKQLILRYAELDESRCARIIRESYIVDKIASFLLARNAL